ncbi:CAP domain-containing protein [Chelatococcus sp. GCM10030263]|uniref:CAP domain-containing protein n=1 Tax=Chelatococcus sp. GCM10030263 TaxID=3273387 RepID=UPI0036184941
MVRASLRALAVAGVFTLLVACTREAPAPAPSTPLFYQSLDAPAATIDAATAAEMISAYRANQGLGPLAVDPALEADARAAAEAMAAADRPASGDVLRKKLAAEGIPSPAVNLSAGYRTLAEAFSGWRDSPAHKRVMLASSATRLGIATAYAPRSKYKVYWALIVAGPRR